MMKISNFKTTIPQACRAKSSEFCTSKLVCLTDSGGGKSSKNRKLKQGRRTFYIASFNIRTMKLDEHLTNLENELQNIKWDVLGISETRRGGKAATILKSGHILFQRTSDVNVHRRCRLADPQEGKTSCYQDTGGLR